MLRKEKPLLKIAGWLYLAVAALSILAGLAMLAMGGIATGQDPTSQDAVMRMVTGMTIALSSVLDLAAGFLAVKLAGKLKWANLCWWVGFLLVAGAFLDLRSATYGEGIGAMEILTLAMSLFYLVSAWKNKKDLKQLALTEGA